jgi:hypothetical protein
MLSNNKLFLANKEDYALCRTTEGIEGICRPPAYCFSQYDNMEQYISNKCRRDNGFFGICCPQNEFREPLVRRSELIKLNISKSLDIKLMK